QSVAVVDQIHLDAQPAEDGSVFAANDAGTIDNQRARCVVELQDGVAVIDPRMVEIDVRRTIRARTRGDDDLLGDQSIHRPFGVHQFDGMGIGETALAEKQIDTVARIVAVARTHLAGDDFLCTFEHIREGEIPWLADHTEDRVGVELNDLLDRVAQRLGWDGAQMDAVTAHHVAFLDHRYPAPILRRVNRSTLTRRACTQYHYIIVINSHS